MLKLNNSIKVYTPVKNNEKNDIAYKGYDVKAVESIGGVTSYSALGKWVNDNEVMNDEITVNQFNFSTLTSEQVNALVDLVKAIFELGQQLAVSVEINNQLEILDGVDDLLELTNQLNAFNPSNVK